MTNNTKSDNDTAKKDAAKSENIDIKYKSPRFESIHNDPDGSRLSFPSNKRFGQQIASYSGECDNLSVILALRSENYNNKVLFSTFIDKLKNYVLTNFNDARDMIPILDKLEDPRSEIISKQPVELEESEKSSAVAQMRKKEEVKRFMKRLAH